MRKYKNNFLAIAISLWYTKIASKVKKKVFLIKKLHSERKIWLDFRSAKILKNKSKRKKIRKWSGKKEYYTNLKGDAYKRENTFKFTAPKEFSIFKNPDETIKFYNDIIKKRKSKQHGATFFIDVSNVETISVDALMYLIAVLNDAKSTFYRIFGYKLKGNFPKKGHARQVFIDSGFLSFVQFDCSNLKPTSNRIKIISGSKIEPQIAKDVCEFIQNKCDLDRLGTIPLYNILIELMGNTNHHAYQDEKSADAKVKKWYLYAEELSQDVRFVFLDTGSGIPDTVLKKWTEKIPIFRKDSEIIYSALNGDFRSQTNQSNRSKGLPQISECCRSGIFNDTYVFSGKGCCIIHLDKDMPYEKIEIKNSIQGTLFCWEINKRGCD